MQEERLNAPKVSIVCTTYNQENYIADAIESFLMQETNFSYEIIIGEDCSTDKTRSIVENYSKKFPNIIRAIYQKENTGGYKNIVDAMNACSGEYLILNEGDDFFTDQHKLQTQVDYLDSHKDCSMCFHPVRVFFQDKSQKDYIFPTEHELKKIKHKFNYNTLKKINYIQTNSCMYRRANVKFEEILPPQILPGDWFIHLYYAKLGKIGYINKVMSAYRRSSTGIWQLAYTNPEKHLLKYWEYIINFYIYAGEKNKDDTSYWQKKGLEKYRKTFEICVKNKNWENLKNLILKFPQLNTLLVNDNFTKNKAEKYKRLCYYLGIILSILLITTLLLVKFVFYQ